MGELIKNKDVGCMGNIFCNKCGNIGIIKVPVKEDKEKFEELYDQYDASGSLSADQCVKRALDKCRCDCFYCPDCEMGLKYKDKYEKYTGN